MKSLLALTCLLGLSFLAPAFAEDFPLPALGVTIPIDRGLRPDAYAKDASGHSYLAVAALSRDTVLKTAQYEFSVPALTAAYFYPDGNLRGLGAEASGYVILDGTIRAIAPGQRLDRQFDDYFRPRAERVGVEFYPDGSARAFVPQAAVPVTVSPIQYVTCAPLRALELYATNGYFRSCDFSGTEAIEIAGGSVTASRAAFTETGDPLQLDLVGRQSLAISGCDARLDFYGEITLDPFARVMEGSADRAEALSFGPDSFPSAMPRAYADCRARYRVTAPPRELLYNGYPVRAEYGPYPHEQEMRNLICRANGYDEWSSAVAQRRYVEDEDFFSPLNDAVVHPRKEWVSVQHMGCAKFIWVDQSAAP